MSTIHELKIWPPEFKALHDGEKTAEFRQNDRDFKVGDHLDLRAWYPDLERYAGGRTLVKITHITPGPEFGIPEGFAVLSIRMVR